jgi:nucleotidyltransferase substrate binding protein (TIGR01987 family)
MSVVPRRISVFTQALARLDEALARPEDPIVRDASIQRFEFTFEMAWKAVQAQAMAEGIECVSPRDCFRTGFRLGLVDNDARWMAMIEDRNRTTHTYDEKAAISFP